MSDTLSKASMQLAESIIGGGIALTFKEGSVLEVAGGQLAVVMEPIQAESLEGLVKTTNVLLGSKEANPFATSFEEADVVGNPVKIAADAVSNDIIPIAKGIIDAVRNNVIPATNEIFQRSYDQTSEVVDRGGILVDICTDGSEKEIWSNPALVGLLEAHAPTGTLDGCCVSSMTFPDLGSDVLLNHIHSVNPVLNPGIDDILGDNAEGIVTSVYRFVFNVSGETCPVDIRTRTLVGLLLAIALKENIPEGVTGGGELRQYRAELEKVADSNAATLKQQLDYSTNITRAGRLVLAFPPEGSAITQKSTIVVNGRLYESWLEAGGSVDAILGAYASRSKPIHGADILENKPQLEREWVKMVGVAQSAVRDNFQRVYVNNLRSNIHQYADETGLKVSAEAIDGLYQTNTTVDPDNAYCFTRDVVVDALFGKNPDYKAVLNEIDAISDAVPGISLEDATELGITDWLTGWAIEQMDIFKRGRE